MTTPAAEVRSFAVTISAGTPLAAPVTTPVAFPSRTVLAVRWQVPPGPSGLMGWRLTMSGGVPVIPSGGGWIIADDAADTWQVRDQPDSGAWEVTGYNTGTYPHTVYLDFMLEPVAVPAAAAVPDLAPAPDLSAVPAPAPADAAVPDATAPAGTIPAPPPPVSPPADLVPS